MVTMNNTDYTKDYRSLYISCKLTKQLKEQLDAYTNPNNGAVVGKTQLVRMLLSRYFESLATGGDSISIKLQ